MTPVMQSKLFAKDGIHAGNCFAAALASLLDLPLWMVLACAVLPPAAGAV